MRFLAYVLLLSNLAVCSAQACNTELVTVENWSIKPVDSETNELTTIFKLNATKPIRMLDASSSFTDALGGRIASFKLDSDVVAAPGDTFSETGSWGPNTFERLLKLRPGEVTVTVCVRAVLYDDGSKETFQ